MSTINCQSAYQAQMSPRTMMDRRIESAVSAGSISKVDQTAMESTLDNIDGALSSSGSGEISGTLDPKDMKSPIDSLIQDQVSGGTLTSDQASQLQSFFQQGAPQSTADSSDSDSAAITGVRGHHGHHGPPPSPPVGEDGTEGDGGTATDGGAQATAMDRLNSLIAFLENLRSGMGSGTYGSTASGNSSSDNSGLVVNATA
jgi:hypothetical protein